MASPASAAAPVTASSQTLSKEANEKTQSAAIIHKQLQDVALRVLAEITADTLSRQQRFDKGEHAQFDKGCHTVEGYFNRMKTIGNKADPQLNFMRKKGHFYFGKVPDSFKYHRDVKSPYGYSPMLYILKSGKPSDALKSLRTGFTFLSCGEACQIACYTALSEVLKDKFDSLFHENAPTPLSIGVSNEFNPINLLRSVVALSGKPNEIKRGQWTSLSVIDGNAKKHICGDREKYNVLCLEEGVAPKFLGFDSDPKGATQVQATDVLVKDYNKNPIIDADIASEVVLKQIKGIPNYEEDLKTAMSLKEKQITLAEYQAAGGGVFNEVTDFNMDRIMQLVDSVPNDGRKLLMKWREEVVKAFEKADEEAIISAESLKPPTADDEERSFVPAPLKSLSHTTNF